MTLLKIKVPKEYFIVMHAIEETFFFSVKNILKNLKTFFFFHYKEHFVFVDVSANKESLFLRENSAF